MSNLKPTFHDEARADELFQQWLEQSLDCSGAEELLRLITTYPHLAERTVDQLQISQMLKDLAAESVPMGLAFCSPVNEECTSALPEARADCAELNMPANRRWLAWTARAGGAVGLLCAIMMVLWHATLREMVARETGAASRVTQEIPRTSATEFDGPAEPTTKEVAVISRSLAVKMRRGPAMLGVGCLLSPGPLELVQGVMRIDFFNGASLILEGPCDVEILSGELVVCQSGNLTAVVPEEAKGFRINTPHGSVLDLGTGFGVSVTTDRADVHVFEGLVELPDFEGKQLKEGEGGRLTGGKLLETFSADESLFTTVGKVDELHAVEIASRYAAWKEVADRLHHDADLLLRLDFADLGSTSSPAVRNLAVHSRVKSGLIVGCQSSVNRWPGERALGFRNLSDRVRIDVPGQHQALTLATWVCVHSLPKHFSGLLMSDGLDAGNVHWQLTRKGALLLCYGNGGKQKSEVLSQPFLTPHLLGRWMHLAVVMDSSAQEVTYYLNGEVLWADSLEMDHPLQLGPASLGNWSSGTAPHNPIRNFCGDMGELTIHCRALTPAELKFIYESGGPH